ncbi:MAG TPA: ThuA domain-containing protein [Candidatus Binataceae bacterium]|nr:ThuA domain-containing protein [Candidatus Binataceae bacterium]
MSQRKPIRVHLVTGGFPPGSFAGHDMDYARLRLLGLLQANPLVLATTGNDFSDIARWLPDSRMLITYVAGPYPNDEQDEFIRRWLEAGGRWLALHGTSGGKAAPVDGQRWVRKMVKGNYHATLGCFFLNHPPVRKFRVDVANRSHPLTADIGASFETMDELYLIELQDPNNCELLLTTELAKDPSPQGFGFVYDKDTSLLPDGKTRALAYTRALGSGAVTYVALGHCHSPISNVQPFVDVSVDPSGTTPKTFRGSWETREFETLLRNALSWGLEDNRA